MAVQISGNDITVPRDGSFTRNVTIGGTLTYEDVTNIDSVGLVTARNGIEIGARPGVAASISVDGNMIVSGISTFGGDVQVPDKIIHSGDTDTAIRFSGADTITAETGGSSRFKIDSSGNVTIGNDGDSGSNPSSGYDELCIEGGNEAIGMCFLSPAANDVEQTIAFGDSNNNQSGKIQYEHANDAMHFDTAGSERVRITSAGLVGIGIAAPTSKLYVNGVSTNDIITARAADTNGASVINILAEGTTGHSRIKFSDTAGTDGQISYTHTDRALTFAAGGTTEQVRIDSSGNVLIGDSAGQIGKLSTLGTGNHISAIRHSTDTSSANVLFAKYRGSRSSPAIIVSGDTLGDLAWYGYNGSSIIKAASVSAAASSTVDGSNMPTDLIFKTTAGNTNSEKLRIASNGYVTKPLNLCLSYTASSSLNYTSSGTLIYATEVFDVGDSNAYNTSTGVFTAPITGIYNIYHEYYNVTGYNAMTKLEKSTNSGSSFSQIKIFGRQRNDDAYTSAGFSHLVQANANDQFKITWYDGQVHINNTFTHFQVQLVQ